MRRTLATVVARSLAGLATVLLLASCTQGSAQPAPMTPDPSPLPSAVSTAEPTGRYVALGDSYSAGPLIPTTDLAGGCARSDHNYPSIVADRLNVKQFVDVTCSGATTRNITGVQRPFGDARIPPQIRKVTADTTLVTIGIGGNDLDLFGTLIQTCTQLRSSDPRGAPCSERIARNGPHVPRIVATISSSVTRVLRAIEERAPDAQVLLVGYPRIVPDSGTCKEMALATGDYAFGRQISRALDTALRTAAARTSATYVDMYTASKGHDVCSEHPWVNGITTDQQKALAFHPFAVGMRADAEAVLAAVDQ